MCALKEPTGIRGSPAYATQKVDYSRSQLERITGAPVQIRDAVAYCAQSNKLACEKDRNFFFSYYNFLPIILYLILPLFSGIYSVFFQYLITTFMEDVWKTNFYLH